MDVLAQLFAGALMTVRRYWSMLAAVLLILIVLIIGSHVIRYQVKLWKCEQMLSRKIKMDRTVCGFPGSLDLEDSRSGKKSKTEWDE